MPPVLTGSSPAPLERLAQRLAVAGFVEAMTEAPRRSGAPRRFRRARVF